MITLDDIKKNHLIRCYMGKANEHLGVIGFTEHGERHLNQVSLKAALILQELGFSSRDVELAAIAGYLHDIGNVINRDSHGISGALLIAPILQQMGMEPGELAGILGAIGNHDEHHYQVINHISAALILADKTDVHRSRVRNQDFATFDIHDRVNYAAVDGGLSVDREERTITLELTIDIDICPVMEYFEIFLLRMVMCRRAAEFLNCRFALIINGSKLL